MLDQGAKPAKQTDTDAGQFGIVLAEAMPTRHGQLFLLLGGIGSGKTTFIKRYQRTVSAPLLNSKAIWFHVDFLEAPPELSEMERFVWTTILTQLRARYSSPHLETRRNIKKAFADKIVSVGTTGLRGLRAGTDPYEDALSPFLARWQESVAEYMPRPAESWPRRPRGRDRHLHRQRGPAVAGVSGADFPACAAHHPLDRLDHRRVPPRGVLLCGEPSADADSLRIGSSTLHPIRKLIGSRLRFALDSLDRKTGVHAMSSFPKELLSMPNR